VRLGDLVSDDECIRHRICLRRNAARTEAQWLTASIGLSANAHLLAVAMALVCLC
jgi:hypothetical protein